MKHNQLRIKLNDNKKQIKQSKYPRAKIKSVVNI